ncbi:hypothetical protein [Nostocoides sp. HKS02]|uniref:hypothetical protein n=1 Tax=Nostocoides sp. HKS02 TaxID=1813880 RepID=UPI0012B46687|nr:hypothetical protein [Tetrasphaera sp. HKS02]QGN58506.1 hypothetical protein GKE56_12105 [Tetrasphaera sp. HKS02]
MRVGDAARLGYGLALLADPQGVARALTGTGLDHGEQVAARVLGVRHVAQAVVLAVDDRALARRAGRVVDLMHAASMLALAAWSPRRRRIALTDATIASMLAALPLGHQGFPQRGS